MKKFLAVLLAVLMMVPMGTVAMAAEAESETPTAEIVGDNIRLLKVGETITLELKTSFLDEEPTVTWSTFADSVISIDQNGTVTALAPGEATVYCNVRTPAHNLQTGILILVYDENIDIFVDGMAPGTMFSVDWSINEGDEDWGRFRIINKSPYEIINATSKDGNYRIAPDETTYEDNPEYLVRYKFQPSSLSLDVDDIDRVIRDTLVITLSNHETREITMDMRITAVPHLVLKENSKQIITLPQGESIVIKAEIIDKAQLVLSAEWTVKKYTSQQTSIDMGEYVINGKEISIPLTIRDKKASASIQIHANTEWLRNGTPAHISLGTWCFVKTPNPTTTPADTTETKESPEQAEYTANKAAEDAAVDVVREANAALAAGKELPAKAQPVTTAAGTTITAVPVKLSGLEASLSLDTMDLLAGGKVGLKASINSGAAEVILPAGFTHTPEPGRFGYPLGFQKDPRGSDLMTELVKGDTAKTETYKLGGNVVLPTTATVTIKTKLDGKVNVYYWNDETRKATLIASPTAADGRVTFATKQLGHLILTTGTI